LRSDRKLKPLPPDPLRHQVSAIALPFLAKLFADSAYAGSIFHTALAKALPNLETEIVRRSDHAVAFVPLPKRWIVERTIAWLNRCRRLAKDWENLNRNALAFLKLASIRLMLRKLCNP
jgi:putative transposase